MSTSPTERLPSDPWVTIDLDEDLAPGHVNIDVLVDLDDGVGFAPHEEPASWIATSQAIPPAPLSVRWSPVANSPSTGPVVVGRASEAPVVATPHSLNRAAMETYPQVQGQAIEARHNEEDEQDVIVQGVTTVPFDGVDAVPIIPAPGWPPRPTVQDRSQGRTTDATILAWERKMDKFLATCCWLGASFSSLAQAMATFPEVDNDHLRLALLFIYLWVHPLVHGAVEVSLYGCGCMFWSGIQLILHCVQCTYYCELARWRNSKVEMLVALLCVQIFCSVADNMWQALCRRSWHRHASSPLFNRVRSYFGVAMGLLLMQLPVMTFLFYQEQAPFRGNDYIKFMIGYMWLGSLSIGERVRSGQDEDTPPSENMQPIRHIQILATEKRLLSLGPFLAIFFAATVGVYIANMALAWVWWHDSTMNEPYDQVLTMYIMVVSLILGCSVNVCCYVTMRCVFEG